MENNKERYFSGGHLRSLLSVSLVIIGKSIGRRHQPSAHHRALKKPQITNPKTLILSASAAPNHSFKFATPIIKFHSTKQVEECPSSIKDSNQLNHSINFLSHNAPERLSSGKIRRNRGRLKAIGSDWLGASGPIANRVFGDLPLSPVSTTVGREVARGHRRGLCLVRSALLGGVCFKGVYV